MIEAVRAMDALPNDAQITSDQANCLLENFRQVVLQTMNSGQVRSIESQARRPRWRFLRAAAGDAADAYSAALRLAGIEVPPWLEPK
jgi:hypothetical protein